jgi:EAL domain-containing protein (putative c-di-GMP-specific phosphodiesterase class I)
MPLGHRSSPRRLRTGYSSLGYLQRFPVGTLKIDRSFVSSPSMTGVRNPEIVQTITSLAESLALKTTAEGIETAAQLEHLRSLGCTWGQGYFFSRLAASRATDRARMGHADLPAANRQASGGRP